MKDIEGYENLYAVSESGEIWSYKSRLFLAPYIGSTLYPIVQLWKGGKPKRYKVHRLVAKAFIPNPRDLPEVNHKNANHADARVENLEWTDRRGNIDHALANKLYPSGERHYKRTLTWETVREIRSKYPAGQKHKCSDIGREYGIIAGNVYRIINHQIWRE